MDLDEFVTMFKRFGTLDFDEELMRDLIEEYSVRSTQLDYCDMQIDNDDEISLLEFIAMIVSSNPLVAKHIRSHLVCCTW